MIRLLAVASVATTVAAAAPCIWGTLRKVYRPVPVTWAVWALLTGVGGISALMAGQLPAAVFALACAAECAVVTVLALRVPARDREAPVLIGPVRLDWICGAGGLAGLAVLAFTRDPVIALAVSVATDFVAYIPTVVHFAREPFGEPWSAFALYALGGALALAAARPHFTAVAYPLYIALADSAGVVIIVSGRRTENRARRSWIPSPDPARWREDRLF